MSNNINNESLEQAAKSNAGMRFPHEEFKRKIIHINWKAKETFAPPIENYSGLDEKGLHTFHNSFKAIWGE